MSDTPLSPYKGLTPFEDSELDVLFFFGRERERQLIDANLMASRLTVLYGETGVGKSSVLRAGVAHHLRRLAEANLAERGEPGLAVVIFDEWRGDPLPALQRAVAEAVTLALGGSLPPPEERGSLAEVLRTWQQILGGDLYVILDQAEEYFLYHSGEEGAGSFAVDFPAVVESPDLRVNFLLAIREDALAKLDAFKGRIPSVLGNYLRLDHLDAPAARAAIVEPVSEYNRLVGDADRIEIEPELVDAVLEQVLAGKVSVGQAGRGAVEGGNGAVRIEAPYLQLVMQRLWDEEQSAGSPRLRLETLQHLGGAEQIVNDHVDDALAKLTRPEQDIAARMLDHLVTPSGMKIAHGVGDLAKYAGIGGEGAPAGAHEAGRRADSSLGRGRRRARFALRDLPRHAGRAGPRVEGGARDTERARPAAGGLRQAAPPPDRGARRRRGRAAGHGRGDGLRLDPAKQGQVAGDARAGPGARRDGSLAARGRPTAQHGARSRVRRT